MVKKDSDDNVSVELVVTHKNKGVIKIPLPNDFIREVYDFGYIIDSNDSFINKLKTNNYHLSFWRLHEFMKSVIDCLNDSNKTKKYYLCGLKPKWKK